MIACISQISRRSVAACGILIAGFLLGGCASDVTAPTSATAGKLVRSDSIATYDRPAFEKIRTVDLENFFDGATMTAGDFRSGFPTTYQNVTLHRVAYESVIPEWNDRKVVAYGLVAIPAGATDNTPIVSYQHGTTFERAEAPSNPAASIETRLALLQYASQGYIVIAADYFGNGALSTVPNAYFLKRSTEQAMFDMHTASLAFLQQKNIRPGKLFLLGWSQGGYNTMLHFRTLEGARIPVAATATAAAPASPLQLITRGLYARRPFDAPWEPPALSNVVFAYETYFGLTGVAKELIQPTMYDTARAFYDFKTDVLSYLRAGGSVLENVFTPTFFETGKTKTHRFWERLSQADSYLWLSKAPLRQYYSDRDEVMTRELATAAVVYQTTLGKTNATSHNAGVNADHRSVYVRALVETKPWFDSLK